jgi:hypothetical protein
MFEPVIFGLTALQFKELGMALITPSLAFVFLFLLALPLKKLPFLDLADDYRPPSWVWRLTVETTASDQDLRRGIYERETTIL